MTTNMNIICICVCVLILISEEHSVFTNKKLYNIIQHTYLIQYMFTYLQFRIYTW